MKSNSGKKPTPTDNRETPPAELTVSPKATPLKTPGLNQVAPPPRKLLSLKQTAARLGVCINTVRNWASRNGKHSRPNFPAIRKTGLRRVGILEHELDMFVDSCACLD